MPRERLTIVIPVLNEEAVLDRLADHLRSGPRGLGSFVGCSLDTKVKVYEYVPEGSQLENLLETGAREIAKRDYLILAFTPRE